MAKILKRNKAGSILLSALAVCIGIMIYIAPDMMGQQAAQQQAPLKVPLLVDAGSAVGPGTTQLTSVQNVGLLTNAGTNSLVTASAANLCALWPQQNNSNAGPFSWDFWIKSTSGTATLTGGSNVTILGTGTASANNIRHFVFTAMTCAPPGSVIGISMETSAF